MSLYSEKLTTTIARFKKKAKQNTKILNKGKENTRQRCIWHYDSQKFVARSTL